MGAKRVDLVGKKCGCYTVLEEIERTNMAKDVLLVLVIVVIFAR